MPVSRQGGLTAAGAVLPIMVAAAWALGSHAGQAQSPRRPAQPQASQPQPQPQLPAPQPAAAGVEPLPAGGLVFVAAGDIEIVRQDLTIGIDRIHVVNQVRNAGQRDHDLLVSFALPDLDTPALSDQPPLLPLSEDNFVDAVSTADNERVSPRLAQFAVALGLDVTAELRRHGIPLFPYATSIPARVASLSTDDRDELIATGILRDTGLTRSPAWVLRSTIWWRQTFRAARFSTLTHSYRPVLGRPAGSLAPLEQAACLDPREARRLEASQAGETDPPRRPAQPVADDPARRAIGRRGARLTTVTYQATAGAAWSDPIGEFHLIVEKPSSNAIVVSCRTGLEATGPTRLEWRARNFSHDQDITMLFIEP